MKRLALVLAAAAAALGTGCGSTCDNGTTLVSWSGGFDGPGGAVGLNCVAAGVATVDLWLDNQYVGNFPCGDYGEAIPGVPTGGNILTVEGLSGGPGSTIVYRDELSYSQPGCGNTALQAIPGAGSAVLNYAFQSGPTCTSATSFIWFTLFDDVANAVDPATIDASSSLGEQQTWACGSASPTISLPNGQYGLQGIFEMTETALNSGVFAQTAYGCGVPITFTVASGSPTPVPVSLADTGVACQ